LNLTAVLYRDDKKSCRCLCAFSCAAGGIIESVELKGNKPQIIMSRTSETFLEKLFEQEIPEVFDGLILVKNVVRIPGESESRFL
jgi:transcription antitermination factor NusA-like protein